MTALVVLPGNAPPRQSTAWYAMVCVCATEASLFACLLTAYFYLGSRNAQWPPPGVDAPPLEIPLAMTAVLLSSSASIWWGEHSLKHGRRHRAVIGLLGALALGIVFVTLFASEYHGALQRMLPQTHAYASLFYLITGTHFAHVTFGLLLIAFTTARMIRSGYGASARLIVATTSLYWHFVDAVWLTIVAVIYLSPRLLR